MSKDGLSDGILECVNLMFNPSSKELGAIDKANTDHLGFLDYWLKFVKRKDYNYPDMHESWNEVEVIIQQASEFLKDEV